MVKIGIPRALCYYKYFPLWNHFFSCLGLEVVESPSTNKILFDKGAKYVVDEACLPVKVYFGHVNNLKDKVDYIFAPRIVSTEKRKYTCPKFMGIPDMLLSIDNLPQIIGPTIDLTKNEKNIYQIVWDIGRKFHNNPLKVFNAWQNAVRELNKYNGEWMSGNIPKELKINHVPEEEGQLNIAVLGHEYILYDKHLSMNLLQKLAELKISVFTTEMVVPKNKEAEVKKLPKKIFWDFGSDAVGAAFHYSRNKKISGLINISSFGCGPDSMTNSMITHFLKKNCSKPFLNLIIDEHTGEAGINTRIEAFYDLLKRRVG
ncbi:MAG: acyl-CoA dehydratase activase-related protein [Bacillota bacterium]